MKDSEEADFNYEGTFGFDPSFNPFGQVEYEKDKYKRGILPKIEELKKEINEGKKEENDTNELKERLIEKKKNHRKTKFKYENGEIYPKDIQFPDIRFIQHPEPHVLITGLCDKKEDWYLLRGVIRKFAEEAYLSYEKGLFFASIASAINCCEYILKYELFRFFNKKDKDKLEVLLADERLTLGKIKDDYLNDMGLKDFYEDFDYLNLVRNSIYHANFKKSKRVNEKGEIEVEKLAPITDTHVQPILAFRVYEIMMRLINCFYNVNKALDYSYECKKDWMNKKNLTEEDLKDDK